MTKTFPALNMPNKTLKNDKGRVPIDITFYKPRTEHYPEGSCYFATVKQMLKGFNIVFTKGTLWRINHLNFR